MQVSMQNTPSSPSFLGLTYGWSYALAAFTLTITGCLPLAWLLTMNVGVQEGPRGQVLIMWLPIMAVAIAAATVLLFVTVLRKQPRWQRHALLAMWALSALGMVGWWKL